MKIRVMKDTDPGALARYLFPVRCFGDEKLQKGMYDDWDELSHTQVWLQQVLSRIASDGRDTLDIYYLEENGDLVGSVFVLTRSELTLKTLEEDGVTPQCRDIAHLTCFHILPDYRNKGLATRLLKEEIFPDLRTQGIQVVYIRSSHYGAFSLYERLGTKVGTYIRTSDHNLYQRLGNIYRICL